MKSLLFKLTVSFVLLVSAGFSVEAKANQCHGVHRQTNPQLVADVGLYFVMPGKVGRGSLEDTRRLLPSMEAGGVKNIWLAPIHPQTKSEYGVHGKNDHGYWPSDHGKIAFGGETQFTQLVQEAKDRGIGIWVDAVVGHFGYGEQVQVHGRKLSLDDPQYFRVSQTGSPLIDPKMEELSAKLDNAKDRAEILSLQKQIAQIPIYHLPKIRHDNPEMADYLIESYGRFVDLGATGFRVDAAKHIDLDFLKRFVSELQARGLKMNGRAPEFLFEFTLSNSKTLDAFVDYVRAGAKDPNAIYAIDFPMAYELRRLKDKHYRMDWLMGFVSHRWQHKQKIRNLIPFIENHDFEGLLKDPFIVKLTYALADFFSGQSPIVSHGLESSLRKSDNNRPQITNVEAEADLLRLRKSISNSLGAYRRRAEATSFNLVAADQNFMMAERKIANGRKLVMLVNKSETDPELAPVERLSRVVFATTPQIQITPQGSNASLIQLPPKSFILVEQEAVP